MNDSEAISKIQWRINTASEIAGRGEDGKAFEDLEMAIQALEEIQEYRSIGTVEEIRFMQSVCDMSDDMLKSLADAVRAKMEYEAIGTVEEFKEMKSGDFSEHLLNMGYTKGYNKAIDECYMKAKTLMEELVYQNQGRRNGKAHRLYCMQALEFLRQVAEQMKGEQNG